MAATFQIAACLAGLIAAFLVDTRARPRPPSTRAWRRTPGLCLLVLQVAGVFGLFMTVCGNIGVSIAFTLAVLTVLVIASNAKHAMLGEPLVFSDLALVGSIFRHPQFYLSAVPFWQRALAATGASALLAIVVWQFMPDFAPHGIGLAIMLAAAALLAVSLRSRWGRALAQAPQNEADVRALGLTPTLLLYWLRWRQSCDPAPCPSVARRDSADAPELVVVIQCESFADPAQLFGDNALTLPNLAAARNKAWQHGNLHVSGFGAYTMRTEYAVLFGRDEEELGFRRYDPFLTALGEASYALPARLGPEWRSLFLHPHDMSFYGRDRIIPAAGFAELVGEDRFAPPAPGEGRYVTDAAMTDEILKRVQTPSGPSLLYAVTIENHGPWAPDGASGGHDLRQSYLRLVGNSDAMLGRLMVGLAALHRPTMLVFFGDHRPSIPQATDPSGPRHTPYVILRTDGVGGFLRGDDRPMELTPAGLHHAMLDIILGEPV